MAKTDPLILDAYGAPATVEDQGVAGSNLLDAKNVLPNSLPRETRGVVFKQGVAWKPIYCANCGGDGGLVPEAGCDFAFYLCQGCAEKQGPITGYWMMPDEVYWEKVKQAQLEEYGRELFPEEIVEALKDENSIIAKLAKDKPNR
jgi:hypothetical protein